MKKIAVFALAGSLTLTSCYTTSRMGGDPAAVQAGASIGGILGSIIGDRAGGFHGSQFGALVGTVAGAAIGNAATTPRDNTSSSDDGYNVDRYASRRNYTQQYTSTPTTNVEVTNIRFIDDNRNQCIDAEEECKLVFEVVNNGSTPAYNVTPIVEETSGLKHLAISSSTQIGYMPAGNRVRYTATVRADRRIKTGQADLRVYVTESNGGVSDVHEFSLPTQGR